MSVRPLFLAAALLGADLALAADTAVPAVSATAATTAALQKAGLPEKIMIDCSHANSNKQYERQLVAAADIAAQIAGGDHSIFGVMAESHLVAGAQKLKAGETLTYGQSITDACLGWEDSETLLEQLAEAVEKRMGRN